jgi:hypothetical protein
MNNGNGFTDNALLDVLLVEDNLTDILLFKEIIYPI